MSLESHIAELRHKHALLEDKVRVAVSAHDPKLDPEINKLKKKKLALKDQIAALRLSSAIPAE
ncbi:MAG: DUF465 domain-containing protein [Candidatus Paceibacterota bacterium]